ncbi:MAG: hypothetical protein GF398_19480 [Chitinivibrionales bacterium]|nr:hypothetical protein [Chitinivibrionales bacterium]
MHMRAVLVAFLLAFAALLSANTGGRVPLPPFVNGGIASLWYPDHKHIEEKFGAFELLNYANTSYRVGKEGVADTSWKLVAMGNYLPRDIQFATLAHVAGKENGILLIMFEWAGAGDTAQSHGVFYTSFIGKKNMLIRTKQTSGNEGVDTLEFSCADTQRRCGKCFFDERSGSMQMVLTDKD